MISFKSGNLSLNYCHGVFQAFGLWRPDYLTGFLKYLYNFYSIISLMFIIGTYIIMQVGDLVQVWGNLTYMTGNIFLLFTNVSFGTKVLNTIWRKQTIQGMLAESYKELSGERRKEGRAIVKSCNNETSIQLAVYLSLSMATTVGWAASAEKNQLPLRAWYPYDAFKTPAYQLTYAHQSIAIVLAANINVCVDTLITSLVSICRCRLRLLSLSLATLCDGLDVADDGRLTAASDKVVSERLRIWVLHHQAALTQATLLRNWFSFPLLVQFFVSMVIVCVSAYQLAFETTSSGRLISMVTYLAAMLLQVFVFCYQGNQLVKESEEVCAAAYTCSWYTCSIPVRRTLLIMMSRSYISPTLTAGGFTQLSLETFMAILKASYSFFTVLQQMAEI